MSYELHEASKSEHLAYFKSLKGNQGHLAEGLFIAESPKIVEHVLRSPLRIRTAFLTPEYFERYRAVLGMRPEMVEVIIAEKHEMEAVVGYPLHQGVMLTVAIPTPPPLKDLLAGAATPIRVVALNEIADAENMGTIIRTCAAFGVTALLIDAQCCDPYLRRSVRVSMGTIINLTVIRTTDLVGTLGTLSASGSKIIGAALGRDSLKIENADFNGNIVFVFGSEGKGLTRSVKEACELLVEIPIAGEIDSLNVGVACGIFLDQARRARLPAL